ncbi:MAG: 1-phosphofructokinase [Bulleidia sp.]
MIYTLTLNPSLDYLIECSQFMPGKTNRAQKESITPGGKGINVSLVLRNLNTESTALGFLAGFTGKQIQEALETTGIHTHMIHVKNGLSRINVKLKSEQETEVNGIGPTVSEHELQQLMECLEQLNTDDILVMSGSIPRGVPADIYASIMKQMERKQISCIVDTSGQTLLNTLPYHPFLIKPNRQELEELCSTTLHERQDIIHSVQHLQNLGACNVIVSLGGEGAYLFTESGTVVYCPAPKGEVVNSVGAGDSLVAGMLYRYTTTHDLKDSFLYGTACGSASAFRSDFVTKQDADALYAFTSGAASIIHD